ncbi:NAD(P)H-quinone oxidoreductase [Salinicola peritrichatus]|uniref:NAD(P)H-quinone oxidoreductase n=1 Tax=Salinicola peritrichatus TaxID=1267424 RepID=UPI000DA11A19|nr:NAD(P)H-quinone oxidoreductase [Salinicola peritrichatus]
MQGIAIEEKRMVWREHEDPGPLEAEDVRIDIAWAGVNRADLMQRAGNYPPPPGESEIPGLEVSGTVVEVGRSVERFRRGDRVCALLAGGGYAEQVVVNEAQVLPIPHGLGLREAAALPEVFATAWLNLYMEGAVQPGQRVLLHAAASGVGTAAIQLCRAFGNPCFVTAGSSDKLEACYRLGADAGWNRHDGSFVDAVKQWGGADMILDPVGGDYIAQDLAVLNVDGRLVLIGLMGGAETQVSLGRLLVKRQRIIGSTLRSRSAKAKGAILDALYAHVWPKLASGEIEPLIASTWPVQEAESAMQYLIDNANIGKVLLSVGGQG